MIYAIKGLRTIIGYFNNKEDADKYSVLHQNHCYQVKPIENLLTDDLKELLSIIKVIYIYTIGFECHAGCWNIKNYIYYQCSNSLKYDYIRTTNTHRKDEIQFIINIDHDDEKLAVEKAKNYLAELLSYDDNHEINPKYIKMMNERFQAPFKEQECIRIENEIREHELAELKRLKEKYES